MPVSSNTPEPAVLKDLVFLENLPHDVFISDIRDFFSDLHIPAGSIKILGDSKGRAFVGFLTSDDAKVAVKSYDKCLLKGNKVRVNLVTLHQVQRMIYSCVRRTLDFGSRRWNSLLSTRESHIKKIRPTRLTIEENSNSVFRPKEVEHLIQEEDWLVQDVQESLKSNKTANVQLKSNQDSKKIILKARKRLNPTRVAVNDGRHWRKKTLFQPEEVVQPLRLSKRIRLDSKILD